MKLAFCFIAATILLLVKGQLAFAQTAPEQLISEHAVNETTLSVDLTLNLQALPQTVSYEDVQIFLNDTPVKTKDISPDGRLNIPITPGQYTLKAWVPGKGADKIAFEAKPTATGKLTTSLTPYLVGLSRHIENYDLNWTHSLGQNYVPTTHLLDLNFMDESNVVIPVTQVMDTYLSAQYSLQGAQNITELLSVSEPGKLTIENKDRFAQIVESFPSKGPPVQLHLRARDSFSGLDYQAQAIIKLAPVSLDGKISFGETVPDTLSLEDIKVSAANLRVQADEQGRFSISGVPSGELHFRAYLRELRTLDSGKKRTFTYEAQDSLNLSGPAKLDVTLERRRSGTTGGIKLISHDPIADITAPLTAENTMPDLKPHIRFKMINLIALSSLLPEPEIQKNAEDACQDLHARQWRINKGYCAHKIHRHWSEPIIVSSGPEAGSEALGEIHIVDNYVWFVDAQTQSTAIIPPKYHLSDWGYGSFGYAVTLRDYANGKVAISLPSRRDMGWVDMASLLGKTGAEDFDADDTLKKSHTIGFSHLTTCGWTFGDKNVFVEEMTDTSFTYREPTPHDLWSPYDGETEQPPLGGHESITVNWEQAYTASGTLLLVPNPGKEC